MLVSGRVNHVTDKTTSTKRWVLLPLTSKGLSLGTLANAVDRPPISLRRHGGAPNLKNASWFFVRDYVLGLDLGETFLQVDEHVCRWNLTGSWHGF